MTPKRYAELERDCTLFLTAEEVREGWHFCNDWDGMLIHKDYPESEACSCSFKKHEENTNHDT